MKTTIRILLSFLCLPLAASCVATKADLVAMRAELDGRIASGDNTIAEVGNALGGVIDKIEAREMTAADWAQLALVGTGLLTGTGAATGIAVNRVRDGKRKVRGEPVAVPKA